MGVFDQAARFATRSDPEPVVRRLLIRTRMTLPFREWLDTRTIPLPGGPERTADLVAALDDRSSVERLALMVFEFQAQVDPDKLDVTLEEAGILRARARHGEDRKGKYRVLTALVYLRDRCPADVIDMTLPGGLGTWHSALVWNVGEDRAAIALEGVASGQFSWGTLFWVALMAGGGEDAIIARWKEVVSQVTQDRQIRGNLAGIALVFAELVGRKIEWKRGLEGFHMTESQVVNEWISEGEAKGMLKMARADLLDDLRILFPGFVTDELARFINQQESLDLLADWRRAALRSDTFEQFMDVLKR
jgi:hypothetical protein